MQNPKIAFFGTPEYSVLVLDKLFQNNYSIACVVTKPNRPIGRKHILTETPTALWAKKHQIPLLTPQTHPQIPNLFADSNKLTQDVLQFHPNLIIVADFTQKIPMQLVNQLKYGGLNVHPSLLPSYRGPAPIPWAILKEEKEIGVTLVTLAEEFDAGKIIAQEKQPILETDTTLILMNQLFTKGADLLIKTLPIYIQNTKYYIPYTTSPSYFPRLTRETGFIPFEILKAAIKNLPFPENEISNWPIAKYFNKSYVIHHSSLIIHNLFRALYPWPGLWTKIKINGQEKRMKILKLNLNQLSTDNYQLIISSLQLEGKNQLTGKNAERFLKDIIS